MAVIRLKDITTTEDTLAPHPNRGKAATGEQILTQKGLNLVVRAIHKACMELTHCNEEDAKRLKERAIEDHRAYIEARQQELDAMPKSQSTQYEAHMSEYAQSLNRTTHWFGNEMNQDQHPSTSIQLRVDRRPPKA